MSRPEEFPSKKVFTTRAVADMEWSEFVQIFEDIKQCLFLCSRILHFQMLSEAKWIS